jgi:hypothetical protein
VAVAVAGTSDCAAKGASATNGAAATPATANAVGRRRRSRDRRTTSGFLEEVISGYITI